LDKLRFVNLLGLMTQHILNASYAVIDTCEIAQEVVVERKVFL